MLLIAQGDIFKLLVLFNHKSKAKDIKFTVIYEKGKQEIITLEGLE